MPSQQFAVVLVGKLNQDLTRRDFLSMNSTNIENILVVDVVKVDVDSIATEHIVNDIRVVDDFIKVVHKILPIAILEVSDFKNLLVGKLS
jgi:hypothetical protein